MTNKTSAAASDADRQAVLDVLKGVYEAWEANDAGAFVADYLDDASVVQPGVYKKDRQQIQSTMAGAFAGPLNGSRVIDQPQDIRFPNEDTAIVISEGGIVFPGQDTVPSEGTVRATWVLARRDGRWYVAAYHYSAAN
ncbi:MAG: SgcJ/EcaC family oxidoreductase [Acidimicrobiales bacterium]